MNDTIHCILYSILYKIVDDFYDEDIYKEYFPNANIFFYVLIAIYTIYLFYFKNRNHDMFIILIFIEACYIICLFFSYAGLDDLSKIGEINVTLDDPFTILTSIQLPMFLMSFYKIIRENFILWINLSCAGILFGIIQDVDNSILGKYLFKNRYRDTPDKKKYKFIYRLGLAFLYFLYYKFFASNKVVKCGNLFILFYLLASVVSLYIQIMLQEYKEHKIFIGKVANSKNSLLQ
jgi:hypothetical protein